MAPAKPQQKPQQTNQLTQQDREDNSDAVIGAAENELIDRGQILDPRQGQDRDDDDRGSRSPQPPQKPPQDNIRSQIAARFRRAAPENERPFNGDMSDPENLYGQYGAEQVNNDDEISDEEYDRRAAAVEQTRRPPKPTVLAEPGDTDGDDDDDIDPNLIDDQRPQAQRRQAAAQEQDEPRMITRVVRGKKVTKSEEEWLDLATRVDAADSYLEETRELLRSAKEIRATRTTPTGQHPDRQTGEDDDLALDPPEAEVQHPEPSFRDVVQKLQYGDPEEAAAELERIVDARASKAATSGQLQRSYDQDLARSQKALKAFTDANPDLAKDEIAAIAIERGMYRLYEEDMLALGLEKDQLPKTPKELANWHRFYRINGYEVRPTAELLNESKKGFLKWRGGPAPEQTRQRPSRQEAPRVRVNVQRDDRRMAIPAQPQRAVTPRRDAQQYRPATGSDVVAQMRAARGQV